MAAKKHITQELWSTGQVAKKWGRSGETVRRAIKSSRLKAHWHNGDYVILSKDLEEYEARFITPVTDV